MTSNKLACALSTLSCLAAASASAQDANQAALQVWAQSAGAESPAVIAQPDGTSRLSWQLQASADAYDNSVSTAGNATINSPLQGGTHHKGAASIGLKTDGEDGSNNFVQAALLTSDDRAVLAKYNDQVTTFQFGRRTATYQVLAGDVAANYSSLSSNLGLRGVMSQVKIDRFSFSAHAGTVAESWEALGDRETLTHQPARSIFLRDVFGFKVDYEAMPGLRVFATTQGFNDRPASVAAGTVAIKATETTSGTVGVTWQIDDLQLSAETASSRFGPQDEAKRRSDATVVAATLRKGAWQWRAGYNDIAPRFVSLAAAAAPGINEAYAGVDWQATPSVTLGLDLRSGANRTAETEITPSTQSRFDAVNTRAGFNLKDVLEGLSVQVQDSRSKNETPAGVSRGQNATNLNLNLARQGWNLMLGLARTEIEDRGNAACDSTTSTWQAGAAHQWTGNPDTGAAWNASLSGTANLQRQRILLSGQETESRNHGLNFAWQHPRWGNLNLVAQAGVVTPPNGGPDLKQRAYQADASYPFTKTATLKAYWRQAERNAGSDALKTVERLGGANLVLNF